MFDACCGGVVTSHVHGYDFVAAPYLARTKTCTHCKTSKVYRWDIAYSVPDLIKILSSVYPSLSTIVDITVTKRDAAGLVKTIIIKDKKKNYTMPVNKFRSLVRGVKSFCFSITKRGNTVYIKGRGYGHHMGLCQWGARDMVREGYSFRQILSFYFPGVSLMRLQG
jgi:stage II sporulation protein D